MTTPTALPARLTRAGLAATANASRTGLAVQISHIALGRGRSGNGYQPSGQETGLAAEVIRVAVGSGELVEPGKIAVTALFQGPLPAGTTPFFAQELGLFLTDGTLFAIHSDPVGPISWISGAEALIWSATLSLAEVPPGSVTWIAGGPSVNIMLAEPFATMAQGQLTLTAHLMRAEAETARRALRTN